MDHPNKPTLVLLPGLDGTGKLFRWFTQQLPADQPWVTVQYPTSNSAELDTLADIAHAALPEIGPAVIIAESFSGPVALRLLARKPRNVVGAIFVASFARRPSPALLFAQMVPAQAIAFFAGIEILLKTFCVDANTPTARTKTIRDVLKDFPPSVLKARLNLLRRVDESEMLKQIGIPVLYLRASNDRLIASRCAADFNDVAECSMETIPGPHFLLQARPEECWKATSEWLPTTTRAA
jgi:pimeloyl-[acyl-carrier protein] methyl ester esterase